MCMLIKFGGGVMPEGRIFCTFVGCKQFIEYDKSSFLFYRTFPVNLDFDRIVGAVRVAADVALGRQGAQGVA